MKKLLLLTVIGTLMIAVSPGWGEIPHLINYQGMLTDDSGNPLNGNYNLTFKIYSQSSGGAALWTETQNNVSVENGLLNVIMGSVSPVPSSVFSDTLRFLGITVEPNSELTPRIRLTSVGYAYRALVADSAVVVGSVTGGDGGWVDDGAVVRLQTNTDKVGIGTSSPSEILTVAGGDFGVYPTLPEPVIVTDGFNVKLGDPDGVGNQVFLEIDDPGNKFVFNNGNVGIGTTSPDDNLHVANHIRVGEDATYPTVYGEIKHDGGGSGFIINADAGGGWADLHFQTNATTKMFIESGGNVGIGTTSPGEKLEVNGNLKVTGAYKGNIGPNNGAPFPRPAYDSGWLSINQGQTLTLTHNIGGSVDNYVVDLQFKHSSLGIHQMYYGFSYYWNGSTNMSYGACWQDLNTTSIKVYRRINEGAAEQIRVRIWVYN